MIINRIELLGEGKRRKESNKNPAGSWHKRLKRKRGGEVPVESKTQLTAAFSGEPKPKC
jgi:hypothetical protein